jgi:hypothetical protein
MSEARCQYSEKLETGSYQLEIANEVIDNLNQEGRERIHISPARYGEDDNSFARPMPFTQ